jgi:hypothetical protein
MTNYWAARTSLLEEALLHERAINQSVDAGWSSPVARQAHNLKVIGSNPIPATNVFNELGPLGRLIGRKIPTTIPARLA